MSKPKKLSLPLKYASLNKKEREEKPFLYWSYEDSNDQVLNLIQWSDSEFSATMGKRVAEFQFSNILPGSGKRS